MKKRVETKNLIIQLIKYNKEDFLTISDYLKFIKYLLKILNEKNLLNDYEISFDADIESLKRVVEYNCDIFKQDIKYFNKIYLKEKNDIDNIIAKNSIDEIIDNIIKEYCAEQNKENKMKLKTALIFSEYDFIRLFIAFVRLNNETYIDFDNLKYDLSNFYYKIEFQELFTDIMLKEQIEGNYVEITYMIQSAELGGLLSKKNNNEKRIITITEEECINIISNYSDSYLEKMNTLVSEYLYNQYLKNVHDCRTCQNGSCKVQNYEKPVENCLGYIYHEQEPIIVKVKRLI